MALAAAAGGVLLFLNPVPTPIHYLVGVPLLALAVNTLEFDGSYLTDLLSSLPMVMLGLWS